MGTSQQSVCVFLRVCGQVGYLFAGVFVSAGDAPLSSHAPPGTSESSPWDTPCHSWSPETVNRNTVSILTDTAYWYCDEIIRASSGNQFIAHFHLILTQRALLNQSDALSVTFNAEKHMLWLTEPSSSHYEFWFILIIYTKDHVYYIYIHFTFSSKHYPKC